MTVVFSNTPKENFAMLRHACNKLLTAVWFFPSFIGTHLPICAPDLLAASASLRREGLGREGYKSPLHALEMETEAIF